MVDATSFCFGQFRERIKMRITSWTRYFHNERKSFNCVLSLADAERDKKNWLSAAEYYRQALMYNPEAKHLLVQLSHMLKELGNYVEAEKGYRQYAELYPEDADIHLQLGHLFNRQNRINEAWQFYKQAAQLDPDNKDIAFHLQAIQDNGGGRPAAELRTKILPLMNDHKWFEAYILLKELVDTHGHYDLETMLGNVCKELGDFDEAWSRYHRAAEAIHDSNDLKKLLDIKMQMGHLCKIEQKWLQALQYYKFVKDSALVKSMDEQYKQAWQEINSIKQKFISVIE